MSVDEQAWRLKTSCMVFELASPRTQEHSPLTMGDYCQTFCRTICRWRISHLSFQLDVCVNWNGHAAHQGLRNQEAGAASILFSLPPPVQQRLLLAHRSIRSILEKHRASASSTSKPGYRTILHVFLDLHTFR